MIRRPPRSTLFLHDALPISAPHQPPPAPEHAVRPGLHADHPDPAADLDEDRKSTRLNSSHTVISYAVFCLKKKKKRRPATRQARTSDTWITVELTYKSPQTC